MHHDRRIDVSEAWVRLTGARMLAKRFTAIDLFCKHPLSV